MTVSPRPCDRRPPSLPAASLVRMPTLRSQRVSPGDKVEVTGLLLGGVLEAVGPPLAAGYSGSGPTGPIKLDARLDLPESLVPEAEGLVTVIGTWDGRTILNPATFTAQSVPWFSSPSTGGHAEDPVQEGTNWVPSDVKRAVGSVPTDGLLVIGEGLDHLDRYVAKAMFLRATREAITWEERFPPGLIESQTWVRPAHSEL